MEYTFNVYLRSINFHINFPQNVMLIKKKTFLQCGRNFPAFIMIDVLNITYETLKPKMF